MLNKKLFRNLFGRGSARETGRDGTGATDIIPGFSPSHTQYPQTDDSPLRFVVIGLDFGTAFTKVVIADKSDSYAVRLRPDLTGLDSYLLPGLLRKNEERVYELAQSRHDEGLFHNLKIRLIENPGDKLARANAAGFLALVLQRARMMFMHEHQEIFARNRLDWHLNIGLPAENHDNQELVEAFRAIAQGAWALSVSGAAIDPARALVAVQDAIDPGPNSATRYESIRDRLMDGDKIGVIPEVVAETASYARSPLRNDGLHVLVDVGAGTLDINAFKLFVHDDEDRYTLFLPKVYPLGSAYLARHRIAGLKARHLLPDDEPPEIFDEYAIALGRDELESQLGIRTGTISQIDGPFQNEVGGALWDVINEVRRQYGEMLHDWHEPVLTFLAGGGSSDSAYAERVEKLSRDMVTNGQGGLQGRPLPKPDRFRQQGVAEKHFHRFAVAYGLGHDPLDLGDFIPRSQIRPVTLPPLRRDWRDLYVSSDET